MKEYIFWYVPHSAWAAVAVRTVCSVARAVSCYAYVQCLSQCSSVSNNKTDQNQSLFCNNNYAIIQLRGVQSLFAVFLRHLCMRRSEAVGLRAELAGLLSLWPCWGWAKPTWVWALQRVGTSSSALTFWTAKFLSADRTNTASTMYLYTRDDGLSTKSCQLSVLGLNLQLQHRGSTHNWRKGRGRDGLCRSKDSRQGVSKEGSCLHWADVQAAIWKPEWSWALFALNDSTRKSTAVTLGWLLYLKMGNSVMLFCVFCVQPAHGWHFTYLLPYICLTLLSRWEIFYIYI